MGKRSREKRDRRAEAPAERAAPATVRPREATRSTAPRMRTPPAEPVAFGREDLVAAGVLFGLALLVRALLLIQIAGTPYLEVGNIDSTAYHQWALKIANGAWWPDGTFYQSPFYAYFLAVLYKIFGPGPWAARVVQVLLGSLSPVLLYVIGAQLFSRRVGWIAGIGLALYGPIVLEEITFSKTSILVVTALAGFALYLREAPRGGFNGMLVAGLIFGVTVVGVGQWLPPFVALVAWTWMLGAGLPADRRRDSTIAFAVGGLLVIVPLVMWNSANGGGLVLTSGDAGLNFYSGNNERAGALPAAPSGLRNVPQFEEADGKRLAERAVGHPLTPAEVTRYWTQQGTAWIKAHPGDWLAHEGLKLVALWNHYEVPDNYEYTFMRRHFLPLLWPLVTFAIVGPLALVGAAMPFWRRRDVTALYIACFGYLTTILIFYLRGRYRMPAVPFLILLGAVAVDRVWRAARDNEWSTVGALAGGLAVAGIFTNHQYCEPSHHGMRAFCMGGDVWFDEEWLKLAEWYRNAHQLDRAITYAERARECTQPRSPAQIASWIAELETMRTEELMNAGNADEATPHFTRAEAQYREAIRLGFDPKRMQANLGSLYAIVGKPGEAVNVLEAAFKAGSTDAAATSRLARSYVALGRCADAERVLGKLDRDRGYLSPSDDTKAILATCGGAR